MEKCEGFIKDVEEDVDELKEEITKLKAENQRLKARVEGCEDIYDIALLNERVKEHLKMIDYAKKNNKLHEHRIENHYMTLYRYWKRREREN